MSEHAKPINIAILDDYQNVALRMADWKKLDNVRIKVFTRQLRSTNELLELLAPFAVVCIMRERTPFTGEVLTRLPNLKLIASTGPGNAAIDLKTAAALGIEIRHTRWSTTPTIELTWALILGMARHIPDEVASVRNGGWQTTVGEDLAGKTLGVLGLGNIGAKVAAIGAAFGMNVIAWSENLTAERAAAANAKLVSKTELLSQSDVVTVHMKLGPRTEGMIGREEFGLMKPTSRLVNTSRGPLVREVDLIEALESGSIAGAGLDVYDLEPLHPDHPFRSMPHVLALPHLGYVSENLYRIFFGDTVNNIQAWISTL